MYHFKHIDSGLLYRKVAYYYLHAKQTLQNVDTFIKNMDKIVLDNVPESILRSENVAQKASEIAVHEVVRNYVNDEMKQSVIDLSSQYKGFVIDGRDIGSVVFPDADVKLFLHASENDRLARRIKQNKELKIDTSQDVDLKNRDNRDATRKVAPLVVPHGSIVIDTSSLSIQETLSKAQEIIDFNLKISMSLS
jgi:cytidylate kinase